MQGAALLEAESSQPGKPARKRVGLTAAQCVVGR
jgi:hypothetical protein